MLRMDRVTPPKSNLRLCGSGPPARSSALPTSPPNCSASKSSPSARSQSCARAMQRPRPRCAWVAEKLARSLRPRVQQNCRRAQADEKRHHRPPRGRAAQPHAPFVAAPTSATTLELRTFKKARFGKDARKAGIGDAELCRAIRRVIAGQADDLGGGVFKKRLNDNMHRSIILAKGGFPLAGERLRRYDRIPGRSTADGLAPDGDVP